MREFELTCLLCGKQAADLPGSLPSLIKMKAHAAKKHGVSQEDIAASKRQGDGHPLFVWVLPDGRPWLKAVRIA